MDREKAIAELRDQLEIAKTDGSIKRVQDCADRGLELITSLQEELVESDLDFRYYEDSVKILFKKNLKHIANLKKEMEKLEKVKDGAYWERNQLVAALSKVFPSWLEKHPAEDKAWEDDWRNIVFIQLPTGQASWHIHDSELKNFAHLQQKEGNSWDGHSVEEKYKRIEQFSKKRKHDHT